MKQTDPQFKLRFPPELKRKLDDAAAASQRTVSAEIIARLEATFSDPSLMAAMAAYASGAKSSGPTLLTDPDAFAEAVARKLRQAENAADK